MPTLFRAGTNRCGDCIPQSGCWGRNIHSGSARSWSSERVQKRSSWSSSLKWLDAFKQPRLWNDELNATLHWVNFNPCYCDLCLYVRKEKSKFVIIARQVDDLNATFNSSDVLFKVKAVPKKATFSWCLTNLVCKIINLVKPCCCWFQERCPFCGRKFIWGGCSKIIEHQRISDVCYDWNKTRYYFCFDRNNKVCIKALEDLSCCCYKGFEKLQFSQDFYLRLSRGKSYPCMVTAILHGAVRNMFPQLLVFHSFDWSSQLVCMQEKRSKMALATAESDTLFDCAHCGGGVRAVALALWIGCPHTRELKRATTWSQPWSERRT